MPFQRWNFPTFNVVGEIRPMRDMSNSLKMRMMETMSERMVGDMVEEEACEEGVGPSASRETLELISSGG